jgi:GT2 family glycosyltransferase
MRRADKACDICLLNDDVEVFHYGWLATLRTALYHRKDFGMVGPSGGSNTKPMNAGRLGDSGLQVVHHLPYWCVLFKRAMLDDIGLLDEAFVHYASDNFHCDTARKHGWKVVWCQDVWLGHKRHGSGLQSQWKKHDQDLYRQRRRKD